MNYKRKNLLRRIRSGLLFYAPFGILYGIFILWPIIRMFYLSTQKWNIFSPPEFIGWENFVRMIQDDIFWTSFFNTIKFTLMSSPPLIILGLMLAILFSKSYFSGFFRTFFFIPYVLSVSAISVTWVWIFNPDPQYGLANHILNAIAGASPKWLASSALALPAVVITTIWWTQAFNTMLFTAGLQSIPKTYYEAAEVDGASGWQQFWHITIPSLKNTFALVIVLQVLASLKIFGQVNIMTGGGPYGSSRVLLQYVYESAFESFRMGYAAAISIIFLLLALTFSIVQLRFQRGGKR
ncbi:sugar ABC transporter permease [Candidatus Bipolaricaulota bacterium]|nr:sugar ABC transporter permease [Candidatus Bipolaricaulota bacterium]